MKRIISILLVLTMVLALCACSSSGSSEEPAGLQVGFARERIHPDFSVPMAGYGATATRMSTGFLDYIQATCIAFREGDQTILMFTQDLLFTNAKWTANVRDMIKTELGIPGDHVMICSTHTHSGPDVIETSLPIIHQNYHALYVKNMLAAAKKAVEDLAPATLYGTKTQTENLNFVRHYLLEDGTYAGDNFGNFAASPIVDHATENDPDLIIVKADRAEDKKDIVIMNWQAHPCLTGGSSSTLLSPDLIGSTRAKVESDAGVHCAYFTGAAGNQNTSSRIPGEGTNYDNQEFGDHLGQIVIDNLANLQPIEGSAIKTSQVFFEYAYNHDDEDKIAEAKQVVEVWNTRGKEEASALAKSLGLNSVHHASSITARVNRGVSGKLEINALRVGDLAFVTTPYEMFTENGKYIKENSPYPLTFVCTLANEHYYYIPSAKAFEYGCYESNLSTFGRGGGEAVAEQLVSMLKGLE